MSSPRKKNVVLILCDQLRKDYLGCYGNAFVRTPNIDSVAESGVVFERCYVANPLCSPSRMSIVTGQYVHNHQLWCNGVLLPGDLPTIGGYLGDQGYQTASVGKAHFEPLFVPRGELRPSRESKKAWKDPEMMNWHGPYWGFQHIDLVNSHATDPVAHYGKWFFENGGTREMISESEMGRKQPGDMSETHTTNIPERLHDSTFVGTRSAEYIREKTAADQAFFLVASFPDPHHPFNPPKETADRYADAPVKEPVFETDPLSDRMPHYRRHQQGSWHQSGQLFYTEDMTDADRRYVDESRAILKKYQAPGRDPRIVMGGEKPYKVPREERDRRIRNTYAMVELIDRGVGLILDELKKQGIYDDTVVIFTADHGELMGDHGLWKKGPFFYEGLLNVPLLIKAPGVSPGRTGAMASLVDLYTTIIDLLDLPPSEFGDGVSLKPALSGGKPRESCLIEYRSGFVEREMSVAACVEERFKFVQYNTGESELVDLDNDPEERINLAALPEYGEIVSRYREKLLLMLLDSPARFPFRTGLA